MVESAKTSAASQAKARQMTAQDQSVMMTSTDALTTKVYAESKGYFQDEFCRLFSRGTKKMMPIINRGTWTRVYSIRQVLLRFLKANTSANQKVNIVSLGAGYDSTYFWLRKHHGITHDTVDYIEFDFDDVVKKKIQTIRGEEELKSMLLGEGAAELKSREGSSFGENELDTPGFKLIAGDVRDA